MKFDSSGLGHTRSDEFTYKWWDHAFNKAASSFNVVVNENEAVVVRTDDADVKGAIKAKLGKISTTGEYTYGFHKAGTLKNGEEEMNEAPTIVEEKDYSLKLSDEELFKLCGGRTAHKYCTQFILLLSHHLHEYFFLSEELDTGTGSPGNWPESPSRRLCCWRA